MIKVSVIIPAYNVEDKITRCLDSVVKQTLDNFEIIVINDGSTDGTLKIIEKYALRYNNMRVVSQSNKGLYKTRKIGLGLARGEYVGWVDADDFVDLNMFKLMYERAIKGNNDLVYCNYSFFPNNSKQKEKWFRIYSGEKNVTFVERNSQPWNKIVKRKLLEQLNIANLFEECFDEAYIKVLIRAKKIAYIEDELYFYCLESGSMSSSYNDISHYKNFIKASENLKSEMLGTDKYWNLYFEYRVIYYNLMAMLVAANANNKKEYSSLKDNIGKGYRKNYFLKFILDRNFSILKSFAIRYVLPFNYFTARILCFFAF